MKSILKIYINHCCRIVIVRMFPRYCRFALLACAQLLSVHFCRRSFVLSANDAVNKLTESDQNRRFLHFGDDADK